MGKPNDNAIGRRVASALLLVTIAGIAVWGIRFVFHRMRFAVTNAVFVRADNLVTLGFDGVSGRLTRMNKQEGDRVKKGEVLAAIDKDRYENRLNHLEAALASLREKRKGLVLRLERTRDSLGLELEMARDSATGLAKKKAALEARRAALVAVIRELERDHARYSSLYKASMVSKKRLETVTTELAAKRKEEEALRLEIESLGASIARAKKAVELAAVRSKKTLELEREIGSLDHEIQGLRMKIRDARKDLLECELRSPLDGVVARKFVSQGDVVAPGRAVYAVLDPKDVYVLVLLEEGKIHGVRPGCRALVHIDAYPDERFEGVVEAVLPASAATFALIPRDVSAGEFTKVAQRIPVRIRITRGPMELLRVGLGGEVEIQRR